MTRITHRTRSESEHHVRGPGRKRPSPWTRNGTRITLGLGVWWGRTQGTPEARCRTQHSGDRPGAQRFRRVADPPNQNTYRSWERQRGATLRHPSRAPGEGPGPCSRRHGLPRTRQGGLALAGAAGQVPNAPAQGKAARRPPRVATPDTGAGTPSGPRRGAIHIPVRGS